MRACIKEIPGRVEYAVEFKGRTGKDIRDRMEAIMNDRGEGLVIKHPNAKYVLNGRNMDWIKVSLLPVGGCRGTDNAMVCR
jgi:DNA ligase 4